MDLEQLKIKLRSQIQTSESEQLQLISFFIYNWTEGTWTPDPLTKEQIEELKRRVDQLERGEVETVSMEEVLEELKQKYGFVRDESEAYKLAHEQEERKELSKMLEEISKEQLIQLQIFLDSQSVNDGFKELSASDRQSINRGKKDSEEGRLVDAFEFLVSDS
jgi:TPP-dependent 2-oxoacid decarboxylase